MSELVERVVLVVGSANARAAIAAMREPTAAMCRAGADIINDGVSTLEAEAVWEAMIDVALDEHERLDRAVSD